MNIESLTGKPLALVLAFLDTKERSQARLVSRLFKNILENPGNDTILWPEREIAHIPADALSSNYIQNICKRLFKPYTKALAFPEKHSGFALQLLSYKDLLISCDESTSSSGEVKIWHMGGSLPVCTATLPAVASRLFFVTLRTITTIQDDWLLRSTYEDKGEGAFFVINAWQLHTSGNVHELCTLRIALTLPEVYHYNDPVPPVRDANRLYVLMPFTEEIQVWDIDESGNFHHAVTHTRAKLSAIKLFKSMRLREGVLELISYAEDTKELLNLKTNLITKVPYTPPIRSIKEYLQPQKFVLHPSGSKKRWSSISFPEDSGRVDVSTLSNTQFVASYKNGCNIYNLWDLNADKTPNARVEIPVDTTISAVHLHKTTPICATSDGRIWKLH